MVRVFGSTRLERYLLIVKTSYTRNSIRRELMIENLIIMLLNVALFCAITDMGSLLLRQEGTNVRNQLELT